MNILLHICMIGIVVQASQSVCTVVTNQGRNDGFGAQFQSIIASARYAELHRVNYVYTPFTAIEHNYANDPEFLSKKESLINFINNFEVNTGTAGATVVNMMDAIKAFEANAGTCHTSDVIKKIKRIFRENKNIAEFFSTEYLNIAIHVRRHNPHDNRVEGTDTPNDIFLRSIEKLRVMYRDQNPLFHVYSQGNEDDFKAFNASDVVLHLNGTVEDSFTAMVFADVLVISPSSFSYSAGILSEGRVYYVPFWHVPLPHWTSVDNLFKA